MVFFKKREKMKKIYLILAFLGIVLPYWAMLAADLGVSGLSFSIFIIHRYRNGLGPNPGKYFLMMFGVGLSLAIPVYLLNFEEKT